EKPLLTLDMVGLTDSEKSEGSIFMGGSATRFVSIDDPFDYNEITDVVFRWGDKRVEQVFAALLEHDEEHPAYLPFTPTAVFRDRAWSLTIQNPGFNPHLTHPSGRGYLVMPDDTEDAVRTLGEWEALKAPMPEMFGKIWTRWVRFSLGTSLSSDSL
ncbi:MAG: hypothetical protein AAB624_00170, partial [Patescibacteria group bacterium]